MTKTVTIQDLELPRNAIVKIIKNATDGKLLQKDAKTAVSRAATYFVSYLTAAAQEQTMAAGQKTIGASHLFTALEDMGWSDWIPLLKAQLESNNNAIQMANRRKLKKVEQESKVMVDEMAEMTEEGDDAVEAILEPLSSTDDEEEEDEGDDGDDAME